MPSGVYERTPATIEAMRQRMLGNSINDGREPWNKGGRGLQKAWNKGLKGHYSSEQNGMWKGDQATYGALHKWVTYHLGRPQQCENCNTTAAKRYEWSNISGQYLRDTTDWARLCVRCHRWIDDWARKCQASRKAG